MHLTFGSSAGEHGSVTDNSGALSQGRWFESSSKEHFSYLDTRRVPVVNFAAVWLIIIVNMMTLSLNGYHPVGPHLSATNT